eukprot:gene10756-10912_t
MKGFLKSAAKPSAKPEEESIDEPTLADNRSSEQKQSAASATITASSNTTIASGSALENDETSGQESRGQMLQRHKRELLAHKKAVQRMGKKSKQKSTKAQKRREKAAAAAAEREARIAAELDSLGTSERVEEEQALKKLLAPLGLGVKEIRADGHCLYRSLEDQLSQTAAAADGAAGGDTAAEAGVLNYQELRELAAEHIRQHKDQFAPFLLPEDEDEDPEEHYERYCYSLETTAVWGGHLEITALADALQRHIKVYAVGMTPISVGEQYSGADKAPLLELCYLRHAFGLGEHYNSTKTLLFAVVDDDDDNDDDENELHQQGEGEEHGGAAVSQGDQAAAAAADDQQS